jgi:phospholipase/lecithinase/hemolysin
MSAIMRRCSTSLWVSLGLGCALLTGSATLASAQGTPTQIVVFGDSLSDPGNGFALLNGLTDGNPNATPPDFGLDASLISSAPYARGGHHLTNGDTWVEQLARLVGAQRSVQPAFASANPFAMNFAIATARARTIAGRPDLPSLSFEVAAFLQKTGNQVPSDALYVIEIGATDVRDAIATGNLAQAQAILQDAVKAIHDTITLLAGLGARHFLVWNVPDAGLTPAARLSGASAFATLVTTAFNGLLAADLQPLIAAGLVIPFDANQLLTTIVNDPETYGLTNVTDACVTPDDPPFTCQTPDEYLFWDGAHPTAAVHGFIADAVAQLLSGA